MERTVFVRVGLAMEAIDVTSSTQFKAEVHIFIEAVKLSLNAIVPGDFTVDVEERFNGFYASVACSDEMEEALGEDAKKDLDKYIQHVVDMVQFYGVHFGGSLLLTID